MFFLIDMILFFCYFIVFINDLLFKIKKGIQCYEKEIS